MAKKILLIESDPVVTKIFQYCFSKEPWAEFSATIDSEEGVRKAFDLRPDLILLDVTLPERSGLEAIKKIRANPETKDVKIIALSHINQKELFEEAFKFGANSYLVEGFISLDDTFKRIKEAVGA